MNWIDRYAIVAGQVGWLIARIVLFVLALIGVLHLTGYWQP